MNRIFVRAIARCTGMVVLWAVLASCNMLGSTDVKDLSSTDGIGGTVLSIAPAAGPNPDRPVFMSEANGAVLQPWGAGGYWPEQLFWEDVGFYRSSYNDIVNAVDQAEKNGQAPVLGQVAWGFDLILGNGGDASQGFADYSQRDGFKQYAAWMNPRKDSYFAQNSEGVTAYPGQGYISFGMPMLPEDISNGASSQTFGEWAGERVGRLALDIHCRGVWAADYFIGINYFTDWHPRLLDRYAALSQQPVPNGSVKERHDWIVANCPSEWLDFIAANQAGYFATAGKVILDGGKTPVLGGQIPNNPPLARLFGNDPRIWSQALDARYWLFFVETQSAGDRNTPPFWTSSYSIGSTASRSPEVAIGAILDADNSDYWGAAGRAGWSNDFAWKYLKHTWLAAGWTYLANPDGSVRRAAQSFCRSYWDAGGVNAYQLRAILGHIPKHPFGPALYYSAKIERSFEAPPIPGVDMPNYYYFSEYLQRGISSVSASYPRPDREGVIQGINLGYWMSDAVDPARLEAVNKPSAWLLYDVDRLPAAERAGLEAVAPVVDLLKEPAKALAAGPIRSKGQGLNILAFVDQNGSVIVMVSNSDAVIRSGSLEFSQVDDGLFACMGLLGTVGSTLLVSNHTGSLPITVDARDTIVFEIPKLHWMGH